MNLKSTEKYIYQKYIYDIPTKELQKVEECYVFLKEFSKDKVIYGINTGFGPMAQFKISDKELSQLQYNLVRSHANGTGEVFSKTDVKAIMLSRLNTFLLGYSGVSKEVVLTLQAFLNKDIYPEIFQHGSVGASGDLVQLAHLALCLIGEGYVYTENGERKPTAEVLKAKGIKPLQLKLRDGLALINGTSCMTGVGSINVLQAKRLLSWAVAISAIINEILHSYDDSFSEELNQVKQHNGQQTIALQMQTFLKGSQLIKSREEHLFGDKTFLNQEIWEHKIQEYYSIRCVPQILGAIHDSIAQAEKTIINEMNSANDNPIVRPDKNNVFHGGNFHGDYVAYEMDKLKIGITKLSVLMERQLNFLLNHKLNEKFPAFLNAGKLGLNFGFQGAQYVATSTTAENKMLSNPMSVQSIPNNNDNQDIVSMGTNSASICRKVIENAYQVTAVHTMAVCQAIDLLPKDEKQKLSKNTLKFHKAIRQLSAQVVADRPIYEEMKKIQNYLKKNSI